MNFKTLSRIFYVEMEKKCAENFYNISSFDGKKIIKGEYEQYMGELKRLFGVLYCNLD